MQSVFHRTEGDHDLISAIHYLQENWCQDIDVQYEWVKGLTDDLNREATKHERLNIVADELFDVIRETDRGPYGAIPNCGIRQSERCALFIRGVNIRSNWKERLTQQLLDGYLQEYPMEKEKWTAHDFNTICWRRQETVIRQVSKAWQATAAKMCHNLRHTGARHEQWYGESKPCCMCGEHDEW
jgi:hypothetical protein